jgi:NlpC/P60 family putative phage cell wall peptidase
MTDIERQRAAVVAEAREWLGTPYHHEARLKGIGVDCAQLLMGVFSASTVGLIAPLRIPHYPRDWHLHRDAERYLEGLLHYARAVEEPPLPGDVALFRFGRTFSHGAIVTEWPRLIHAYWNIGVVRGDATLYPLRDRAVRFFRAVDDE